MKLEVQKAVATGNARARMYLPKERYYRYARGDTLEWDRVGNTMVVTSRTGDAVVWDETREWTGERLVVNRTAGGRVEAASVSSRRIIIYEEGIPRLPPEDARDWKPIY